MFYWLFKRHMSRFWREVFAREVIVAGSLELPPL
jgi:hypothetical protein